MPRVFNQKKHKTLRQKLRVGMPIAERILWSQLKGKNMRGYKFRRQHGIGKFVVDFYCPQLSLAIEIDGDTHVGGAAKAADRKRQTEIESLGIVFLRFENVDIYYRLEKVLETIREFVP